MGVKPDREQLSMLANELKMILGIFELLTIMDGLLYIQWHFPGTYAESVTQLYVPLVMHQLVLL